MQTNLSFIVSSTMQYCKLILQREKTLDRPVFVGIHDQSMIQRVEGRILYVLFHSHSMGKVFYRNLSFFLEFVCYHMRHNTQYSPTGSRNISKTCTDSRPIHLIIKDHPSPPSIFSYGEIRSREQMRMARKVGQGVGDHDDVRTIPLPTQLCVGSGYVRLE